MIECTCTCIYLSHDGNRLRAEEPRVSHIIVDNGIKDFFLVISWERGLGGGEGGRERKENE